MAKNKHTDTVLVGHTLFQMQRALNMLHGARGPEVDKVRTHLKRVITDTRKARYNHKLADCFDHKAVILPAKNKVKVSNCTCHNPLTILNFGEGIEVAVTPKQLAALVNGAVGNRAIDLVAQGRR